MLERILTVRPSVCEDVRRHLDSRLSKHLEKDRSLYAPGRKRVWIKLEFPLSLKHQSFRPGIKDPRLWNWIEKLWYRSGYKEPPETALAIYGDTPITFHPDAPAAAPKSLQINLGGTKFIIDQSPKWKRTGKIYVPTAPVEYTLDMGEVSTFNCKHIHATSEPNKDRWSIIVWRLSDQVRTLYNNYLEQKKKWSMPYD